MPLKKKRTRIVLDSSDEDVVDTFVSPSREPKTTPVIERVEVCDLCSDGDPNDPNDPDDPGDSSDSEESGDSFVCADDAVEYEDGHSSSEEEEFTDDSEEGSNDDDNNEPKRVYKGVDVSHLCDEKFNVYKLHVDSILPNATDEGFDQATVLRRITEGTFVDHKSDTAYIKDRVGIYATPEELKCINDFLATNDASKLSKLKDAHVNLVSIDEKCNNKYDFHTIPLVCSLFGCTLNTEALSMPDIYREAIREKSIPKSYAHGFTAGYTSRAEWAACICRQKGLLRVYGAKHRRSKTVIWIGGTCLDYFNLYTHSDWIDRVHGASYFGFSNSSKAYEFDSTRNMFTPRNFRINLSESTRR